MVRVSLTKVLLFILFIVLLLIANFHINYSDVGNVKSDVRIPVKVKATTRPVPKIPGILKQEREIQSSDGASSMDRISALRKRTLADSCVANLITDQENLFRFDLAKEAGQFGEGVKPRLLVSDQHQAIYCAIGRTGSENWEKIIERMELGHGKKDNIDERFVGAPTLREIWTYREQAIAYRMEKYYKFMFVREPLTRLLSAYKKFVVGESGQDNFSSPFRLWLGHGRGNTSMLESFVDFVLLDSTIPPGDLEWSSYNDLCAPCFVKYDFIGRYETIQEDAAFVFRETNVKEIEYTDPHTEHFEQNFLQELRNALPPHKLNQLFKKYKLDYLLFGYPQP